MVDLYANIFHLHKNIFKTYILISEKNANHRKMGKKQSPLFREKHGRKKDGQRSALVNPEKGARWGGDCHCLHYSLCIP